jgi:glycosyltransferase involved in cell wall biosynthesis
MNKEISFIISSVGKSKQLDNLIKFLIKNFEYEIVLVDNSINRKLIKYNKTEKVKYVYEEKIGLSNARNKGINSAEGNVLVFLDDDIIPDECWINAVKSYANLQDDILVGGKTNVLSSEKFLPQKYKYISGKKDFGDNKKILKRNYLGGCCFIINKNTISKLGKFNTLYGHKGKKMGANEDVLLQVRIRKNKGKIIYDPKLLVVHIWEGNLEKALNRVKIQGENDRILDEETSLLKMYLKQIKYRIFIKLNRKETNIHSQNYFDLVRYKAYVRYNRI